MANKDNRYFIPVDGTPKKKDFLLSVVGLAISLVGAFIV